MGFLMSTRGSIISYTDSAGETKLLQFEDTRHYHGKKLAKTLRGLCGLDDAMSDRSPFEKDIEL